MGMEDEVIADPDGVEAQLLREPDAIDEQILSASSPKCGMSKPKRVMATPS